MSTESEITIHVERADGSVNAARRSVLFGGFAKPECLQNVWRRPGSKLVVIGEFCFLF